VNQRLASSTTISGSAAAVPGSGERGTRQSVILAAMLGVLVLVGFWPTPTNEVDVVVLAANILGRLLAMVCVFLAIAAPQLRKARSVWGMLLAGLGMDTAAAILFMISALEGVRQTGPIIAPLGDLIQLAAYALYVVALLNMRARYRWRVDWRLPTFDVLASVLALSAMTWIFVVGQADGSAAYLALQMGYPLFDFAMLAALLLARFDLDATLPRNMHVGIGLYIVVLFVADGLYGAGFYLVAEGAARTMAAAGLSHGLALVALGCAALFYRHHPATTMAAQSQPERAWAPLTHESIWRSSTLLLGFFFLALLVSNAVRLNENPQILTQDILTLISMGVLGLLVISRQVLSARRIEATLSAQVAERTRDLEEARTALQAVLASQTSLLERAPIGIAVRDAAGVLQYTNPCWQQLALDCPEIERLNPPISQEPVTEVQCRDGQGQSRVFLFSAAEYLGEAGHIDGRWQILTDVTDVKAREAKLFQMAKLATLGEMSTGLAHEMNQPLNIIRLTLTNLRSALVKTSAETPVLSKVARIDDQVDRAAKLIGQMRAYGRYAEEAETVFVVAAAVANTMRLWRAQLAQQDIELSFTDLSDAEVCCRGSAIQFEQVLMNLISNARDAINEQRQKGERRRDDRIDLTLSLHGDQLCLAVEDSGTGISETLADRIFEPFFTTKPVGRGVGLGCSMSHGIISDMGGVLSAGNGQQGARMEVVVPIVQ